MSISRTCHSCGSQLPDHLTDGTCPSCGSAQAGNETPKASGTPAEREGDFVVGSASDATGTHLPEREIASTIAVEPGAAARPVRRAAPQLVGYREVAWLNAGGMGDVYRGIQSGTERTVAIKVMRPGGSAYSANRERFENEIRALARVDHPGVVRVYECGVCDGGPYFSMEFVEGETLSRRVKREGTLEPHEAVRIVRQAAEAVHCAHRVDVLHRDIKPGNIMLAPDGTVKVTDFGLAKHTDADDTDELTQTGVVIGTPSYLPPEQADGTSHRIGPASDVYGLGGTLYHLLTGSPPHPARSLRHVRFQDAVPAIDRRPDLCPILNAILEKSLARDPADRYHSAEQFAVELQNWSAGEPTIAVPPTRVQKLGRWVRKHRVAVLLVGTLFAIGVAAAIVRRQLDEKARIHDALARGEAVTLIGEKGPPRWHDWAIRPGLLDRSEEHDGTIAVRSNPYSGLVLVEDPQTDSFRFRAELMHVGGTRSAEGATTKNDTAKIGLFWGAQTVRSNEMRAHLMYSIDFSDLAWKTAANPKADDAGHPVGLHLNCFVEQPDRRIRNSETGEGEVHRFRPPDPSPPGAWRTVEIEVRPTGVAVRWLKKSDGSMMFLGQFDARKLVEMADSRTEYLRTQSTAPWSDPANWQPRGPLGIFAFNSTVAVRRATVEPLVP